MNAILGNHTFGPKSPKALNEDSSWILAVVTSLQNIDDIDARETKR